MKKVKAVRKEDDIYYEGPFWIIADSFRDIFMGNFDIIGYKHMVDFDGNVVDNSMDANTPHQDLWGNVEFSEWNKEYDYKYFPRGRVSIYKGSAYINIPYKMNMPGVIDAIVDKYELANIGSEIKIEIAEKNIKGNHYDFYIE